MNARIPRLAGALVPSLGLRAWRLLAGVLVFEIGTGMTLPLVIVYLHQARGIGLGGAGIALAAAGAGGTLGTLAAGVTADRYGAGWTALAGLALAATGSVGYLAVHSTPAAVAVSAVQGAGFAVTWVGMFPLLVRAVVRERRGDVLGANYAVTNLGLGIGSTLAGVVLAVRPGSYAALFVADAVSNLLLAGALIRLGEPAGRLESEPGGGGSGYRVVLRDRALAIATALNLLLVVAGYSQMTSAFPSWATSKVGASASVVGFAFAANTWTITLAQLPMLAFVRHRRRTRAVAATGLLFAACWLLVLTAGEFAAYAAAVAALVAAAAVFGLGETLLSPSLPAIVNDLATERLRARYVAVYSLSWQVGPTIGPAVSGLALASGRGTPLMIGLAIACAAAAPAALLYERVLPPTTNKLAETRGAPPPTTASR